MKKYQSINIIVVLLFVSIFTAQAQEVHFQRRRKKKEIKVSSGLIYMDGNME